MKKLFSLVLVFALAAILGVSTVLAQKTTLTIEKLWSITAPSANAARQGFGMDGALYYHKNGEGVYRVTAADSTPELVISKDASGIGAHSLAKDGAGNIVLFGSTSFPTSASSENFIYVQKKGETTGAQIACPTLEGFNRTDFIAATGDVFSAEGGHLYLINNNGGAAFDVTIVNGTTATAASITGMTLGGSQNAIIDVHDGIYHYASAGSGIYSFDGDTATQVEGLTDLNTQCLGATHFTLAGREIWAYHVGGNYTSEFKVLNKTDNRFVTDTSFNTIFVLNDVSNVSSAALRGVWLNAEKIDDNNYMLYAWHSKDGGAVYKVSAAAATSVIINVNNPAMGTVEGAADYAIGSNATVKAIPSLGHSFVAWLNGTDTVSTKTEYTFEVKEDIALTAVFQKEADVKLTLAVNDATKGSINVSDSTVKMGENTVAYGAKVALTAVPAKGSAFVGWYNNEEVYSKDYTIEVTMLDHISLTAKFIETLNLTYELNGGVTNAHGWLSKAHLCLDLQNDYNTAYSSTKAWAKEENGVVYYYINGEWKLPEEVVGTAAHVTGFIHNVTYNTSENWLKLLQTEKWLPLGDYINNLRVAAGNAVADEGAMRADLSGFFLNSPSITDYRKTNDYTIAGQPAAFCPVMKMGFDNPTEVAFEVTLNDPYRAEFIFAGWYTTADFSGEKVTKVSPESVIAGGKLYAKWAPSATLTLTTNQPEMGEVNGPTEGMINDWVTFSANAYDGYEFVRWIEDGNTDNPRSVFLTKDTTFTAEFAKRIYISTSVNMWGWGTTQGDTMVWAGENVTLTAIPKEGYQFVYWETYDIYGNYQTYSDNPLVIQADRFDQDFVAVFEASQYALSVNYDPAKCNIYWYNYSTGEGNILNYGEQILSWVNSFIEISVLPLDGYTFAGWSDGNYENPRYFIMEAHDTIVPLPKLLGVCGYNLCWDYTYGMLDIIGDGDMYDYTTWTLPWQQYAHQIYSISLPDGMTSVGASAFADCRFLESVTIPATVREIRYSAFENNRMLSTVNFAAESALTTIGNWAFYNCHELKNITIPEGVTEIGYAAFYGCTYMSELSLPESMQYIADNGFALCSKLRRMNVAASTPPTVAARTFEDVDRAIPVYVPTESVGLYKAAPVWKEFNIVGRDNAPTSVENTEVNSSNVQKIFRDGQVLIIRDGKTYNAIGQEM